MILAAYGFLNSTSPFGGSSAGSYTKPSGLAASQECSILTTRPVGVALISGDSFSLYSRYYSLVDSSCRMPHLVAVFPVNLVYSC